MVFTIFALERGDSAFSVTEEAPDLAGLFGHWSISKEFFTGKGRARRNVAMFMNSGLCNRK